MTSRWAAGLDVEGPSRVRTAGPPARPRGVLVRMIFPNLPVTDLDRAKAFYAGLGFAFNEQFSDERTASVVIEENIVVMLLTRDRFAEFLPGPIGDPAQATSVMHALSVGSRAEADDLLARAL